MGLDIVFNRQRAVEAGIESRINNLEDYEGHANDLAKDPDCDPGYIEYIREQRLYVRVPGQEYWLDAGRPGDTTLVVRANRWGDMYAPLTKWLQDHRIAWTEG